MFPVPTKIEVKSPAAFSLVEVVMAIGIISFSLIALIGLFGVGMSGGRHASDDTCLAVMITRVAGDLRDQSAASVDGTNYFFDNHGLMVPAGDLTAYYQCHLALQGLPALSQASTNLQLAKLTFTWPASVDASVRPSTNISYATFLSH